MSSFFFFSVSPFSLVSYFFLFFWRGSDAGLQAPWLRHWHRSVIFVWRTSACQYQTSVSDSKSCRATAIEGKQSAKIVAHTKTISRSSRRQYLHVLHSYLRATTGRRGHGKTVDAGKAGNKSSFIIETLINFFRNKRIKEPLPQVSRPTPTPRNSAAQLPLAGPPPHDRMGSPLKPGYTLDWIRSQHSKSVCVICQRFDLAVIGTGKQQMLVVRILNTVGGVTLVHGCPCWLVKSKKIVHPITVWLFCNIPIAFNILLIGKR